MPKFLILKNLESKRGAAGIIPVTVMKFVIAYIIVALFAIAVLA